MRKLGRKCQACNEIVAAEKLHKITRNLSRDIELNPSSDFFGRSVYICKNPQCIKQAIKKRRISRGLKVSNNEKITEIETELLNLNL